MNTRGTRWAYSQDIRLRPRVIRIPHSPFPIFTGLPAARTHLAIFLFTSPDFQNLITKLCRPSRLLERLCAFSPVGQVFDRIGELVPCHEEIQ
jgi:hypothetical protein